jgi:hypothetical protein
MLLRCERLEPPMSQLGQNEKVSQRAFLDHCTPESGHCSARLARQKSAIKSCVSQVSFNDLVGGGQSVWTAG